MKRHSYGELIGMSWKWMVEILFRPFSLKKWIMLTIIIFLAGQVGGNFNMNVGGEKGNLDKLINTIREKVPPVNMLPARLKMPFKAPITPEGKREEETILLQGITPVQDVISKVAPFLKNPKTMGLIAAFITPLFLFILLIILLWIWIRANFSFVFIDSVVRNDASLRIPFHKNKPQGNSFFRWSLIYSFIVLLIFGAIISILIMQLVKAGVFTSTPIDPVKVLSIALPYVPFLIVAWILFVLISLFVTDFVLPIMYKKKIGIIGAWRVFLGIFRRNIREMLLYLLLKLGLFILALIAAIIILIIAVIILLVIGGLLALLGFLIYAITPSAAKGVILGILILVGVPAYAFLGFMINVSLIPIPIFFRIFSIHVLISMDESLDVFAPKTEEQLMLDGDEEKYRRSMRLVWFAVLSPILAAIMGILIAMAIPRFVKTGWKIPRVKGEGIRLLEEIPSLPDLLQEEPKGEIVTVHLKNGNTFEAELVSESESNVAFRVEGGTVVYPRSDILRIERPQEEE